MTREPHGHTASTTPTYRRKLIEVAIPLDAVNRGCEEDKNRKTGHIRNLHKWFAPMPLPSWRAMLFAALVDDPGEHMAADDARDERARLLGLMARLSDFGAFRDEHLMAAARQEIDKALGDTKPTIVDPFCGGGSTILEAQRLGLATQGSDLNPLPVLITTVLCRVPQIFAAQGPVNREAGPTPIGGWRAIDALKNDVTHYASRVRELAWDTLRDFYPSIDGGIPYAYRWAWTVASPNPAARGRHTPLVSDWWLSRHKTSSAWIEPAPHAGGVSFTVRTTGIPPIGTTGRSGARCLHSDTPIPLPYIREQGRAGLLKQALLAVGVRRPQGVTYVAPDGRQTRAASEAPEAKCVGISMPEAALGFRVQQYGIRNFRDLFTRRQALALETFAGAIEAMHDEILSDAIGAGLSNDGVALEDDGTGARAYADAVTAVLALCLGRMAQSNNVLVRWFVDPRNGSGKATPAFDRHAVPMVWDFVETNPFGGSVGDWLGPVLETVLRAFDLCVPDGRPAKVFQQDARVAWRELPAHAAIATDPPYYANIGYADLSDFFYQWLRLGLRSSFPRLMGTVASPKEAELIATPYRHGGSTAEAIMYFREGFTQVFGTLSEGADESFPFLIVYAIKQAEESEGGTQSTGWEVFLGGLHDAGLSVVATWPVRTTTDTRMIGIGNNALASAIFVVGRRRAVHAPKSTRSDFVRELKQALPKAVMELKSVNIAPVDLAQAAIGPGMAVFTRYSSVVDAEGKALSVGDGLALINETLDDLLAETEGDFDAETRWAVAWFGEFGFEPGEYGIAETLSKAKNTSVESMKEAGVLDKRSPGGKVRLSRASELPSNWDPAKDLRLTAWEVVHHLVRVLEGGGEGAAAELVRKLGSKAEVGRELSYRLYTICERKKWAAEALSYNGLVHSWPEITRLAREGGKPVAAQETLFAEDEG